MGQILLLQVDFGFGILPTMSDLEKAMKEKDAEKLAEIILAGFQQLDADLKAEGK